MSLEVVGAGLDELLKQAESDMCEELTVKFFVSVKHPHMYLFKSLVSLYVSI